jgi:O-antigen/teichoic acid export membrane protein
MSRLPLESKRKANHSSQLDRTVPKVLKNRDTARALLRQGMTWSPMLAWAHKGGFAILDQALFAGTNFLANILLARWLETAQYGAFAVAYSVFLLLTTFHTAVLTEPMLVFGAGKYADRFPQYMGLLISGHWWVTSLIALLLALAALTMWGLGSAHLPQALTGLSMASPLILLMWLVRRAFYVHNQPHWAATGGMLYLVLMLAGLYGLSREHWLSAALALVIMGVASLAVSAWLATLLRPQWRNAASHFTAGVVLADHWGYGKWATATAVLSWVPSGVFYLILPACVGLEESAALRAVMNLTMPLLQAYSVISVLLVPRFVARLKRNGPAGLARDVCLACGALAVTALCYWGFLVVFHQELFLWVYSGRYADQPGLIILAGLTLFPWSVTAVLGPALRALERLNQVFWCQVTATMVAITLGLWLLATHSVAGAIAGGLASATTAAVTMTWAMWKQGIP